MFKMQKLEMQRDAAFPFFFPNLTQEPKQCHFGPLFMTLLKVGTNIPANY